MNYDQAAEYHKNYMRNVRSALNRHRKDIGHLVDIVKDNDFKTSKAMLSSKMKSNLKKGLSRPTKHHPIIPNVELSKINDYLSKDNQPCCIEIACVVCVGYSFCESWVRVSSSAYNEVIEI